MLLKQTPTVAVPRTTKSYMGLKASAATIALVGIDDVTIEATGIEIEINSASDSAAAVGAVLPVVDFQTEPLEIETGPTTDPVTLGGAGSGWNRALLRASGRVTLEIAGVRLAADVAFEQATRPNGTKITKIEFGDIDVQLGEDPDDSGPESAPFVLQTGTATHRSTKGIQTSNGRIVLTPQGMAAEFELSNIHFSAGTAANGIDLTASFSVAINTSPVRVIETFSYRDEFDVMQTRTLDVLGGPYFRLTAGSEDVPVELIVHITPDGGSLKTFELGGIFQFEQITMGTGPSATKIIRIAVSQVHVLFEDETLGSVELTDWAGAFIIRPAQIGVPNSGGVAGVLRGEFDFDIGPFNAGGGVVLQINTTNVDVNESVPIAGQRSASRCRGRRSGASAPISTVSFGDFFSLTGDFTVQSSDTNGNAVHDKFIYAAKDVEIFLGAGPRFLADGTRRTRMRSAILVTNAKVGVVKFLNDEANQLDDTFAIYAFGKAELVGVDGLIVSGGIRVLVNHTGRAVVDRILFPGDGIDNDGDLVVDDEGEVEPGNGIDDDGDGAVDEPDEVTVSAALMPFTSPRWVEQFEAGFNESGQADLGTS